MKILYSLALFY